MSMIIELTRINQTLVAKQPRRANTASAKRVKHYDYTYTAGFDGNITLDDLLTVLLFAQMKTNQQIWDVAISQNDDTREITVMFSAFADFPELLNIDLDNAETETEGYDPPDIDDETE